MNSFLQSHLLPSLTTQFPQTEFRISPRPNKHPVLKAYYINGREKAVCVRNLERDQILKKAEYLLQNNGMKNKKIRGRNVISTNESVRGIWSPMHGGIKNVWYRLWTRCSRILTIYMYKHEDWKKECSWNWRILRWHYISIEYYLIEQAKSWPCLIEELSTSMT